MGLVQVATSVSDGTATYLDVTGIDTDDVYMVAYTLIRTTQNNEGNQLRVLKSSSQDTTGNYDQAHKHFSTITSYSDGYQANASQFQIHDNSDDDNGGSQGLIYCYNFNSSSEYSFVTYENVSTVSNQQMSNMGGGVHTVASASNGVRMFGNAGNAFKSGARLTLYRVT